MATRPTGSAQAGARNSSRRNPNATSDGLKPRGMTSTALVLAAGSSRRMGTPKQLLVVRGKPLLELVVGQGCDSGGDDVLVVLGAAFDEIQSGGNLGRARVLVNPAHASGMASPPKAGRASLDAAVERGAVVLRDHPAAAATLLHDLLDPPP